MPIFRKEIKNDFTVVHNAFIRDGRLGIAARGLLLTMLSMADDWNFSVKGLASILLDGECKVTTAIHELEDTNYLIRRRIIDDRSGRVVDWEYIISDEPLPDEYKSKSSTKKKTVENSQAESVFSELEKQSVYKITTISNIKKEIPSDEIINQSNPAQPQQTQQEASDRIDTYREIIKENIEYDWFVNAYENENPQNRPHAPGIRSRVYFV